MKSGILSRSSSKEFFTAEHCYITEVANNTGDNDISVALARVEPGVTTAWHMLFKVDERYLIVSGEGLMELGDAPPSLVRAGDVVRIPAGVRQRITNKTNADLLFYAVCSPRFTPDCYIALE